MDQEDSDHSSNDNHSTSDPDTSTASTATIASTSTHTTSIATTTSASSCHTSSSQLFTSEKSAEFLRNFYFTHFLNNFRRLNDTLSKLASLTEEESKHAIITKACSSENEAHRIFIAPSALESTAAAAANESADAATAGPTAISSAEPIISGSGDGCSDEEDEETVEMSATPASVNGMSDGTISFADGSVERADRVYTDSIRELCETACQLCGKRMTVKSLR